MIRRSTVLCLLITVFMGVALYHVKYQVIRVESELLHLHKEIFKTEEALHLLRAEWAYLNDPKRLNTLASKHLKMDKTTPLQVVSLNTPPLGLNPSSPGSEKRILAAKWQARP